MRDCHVHDTSLMLERMVALAGSGKTPEDGIKTCFEALIAALDAERGFVLLFNTGRTDLHAYLGHGVDPENLFVSEDISQTIIFAVVEDDRPLLLILNLAVNQNMEPLLSSLSTPVIPPMSPARRRDMERQRPVPPYRAP